MKCDHPFTEDAQGRAALRLLIVAGLKRWQEHGGARSGLDAAGWEEVLGARLSVLESATLVLRLMFGIMDKRAAEVLGYPTRGACFMQWKYALRKLTDSKRVRELLEDFQTHRPPRTKTSATKNKNSSGDRNTHGAVAWKKWRNKWD
ncbi:MAG TPA: hypothetical protein VMZ71_09115 [Gemmataceae bacterium]|nr:hypothetical protein [Gemmataceae bacterium]